VLIQRGAVSPHHQRAIYSTPLCAGECGGDRTGDRDKADTTQGKAQHRRMRANGWVRGRMEAE
jgi:hypothetical protein